MDMLFTMNKDRFGMPLKMKRKKKKLMIPSFVTEHNSKYHRLR
jgi:hypothetical protein